jgi:hypothetical protein
MSAFWGVASRSLVQADRRFRCAYLIHHQGDEAVRMSETSVCFYETTPLNTPESRHLPCILSLAFSSVTYYQFTYSKHISIIRTIIH